MKQKTEYEEYLEWCEKYGFWIEHYWPSRKLPSFDEWRTHDKFFDPVSGYLD